ncbi:lipid IV(A) 3-deoxy-D-manno-octulosonic acid transferase [Methylonatrum kenyense]|uniref:lipid IV(A) 3-deoxy-D-manno-octulosonic acid transferase n=1 Tax=Methylonatrum kenyense TaxID=455253 RepID=UPI0020BE23A8|nr:lipid IV(A) 3-deoxy-D-manno-octulosonic acid transferase [Methylonatrum kenyense]MCK8516677.1 lipid IV(A) 3-deoxy-D-manno-octulosonic acid transferase [Methylonatrum kenyense]
MRRLYSALLYLLTPFAVLYLAWRGLREPAYRHGWGERLGLPPMDLPQRGIWVHAASVGEVQAAAGLIRGLQREFPQRPLLITTMTPTGREQVLSLFGDSVRHCFLPLDLPHAVKAFLHRSRPSLALIVEMELWPNLFHVLKRRRVPLVVVNARLSGRSARRYARLPRLMGPVFRAPDRFCAQTADDANRLRQLQAPPRNVVVTGSLKFEQQIPASARERGEALRRELGSDRPVWIAASTRDGEEEQILQAHRTVLERVPRALLLLVPRHPDRFSRVAGLVRDQGFSLHCRSSDQACPEGTEVYLGDSMGELLVFYGAADAAFIGGTLVPIGGHNPLEAAAMGLPVIMGPHVFKMRQVAEQLVESGAGQQVHDAGFLADAVTELLEHPDRRVAAGRCAQALMDANRGATERMLEQIRPLIAV